MDVVRIGEAVEPVQCSHRAVGRHVERLEREVRVRVVVRAVGADREGQRVGGQERQRTPEGDAVEVVGARAQEVVVGRILDLGRGPGETAPDLARHGAGERHAVAAAFGRLARVVLGERSEQAAVELALRRPCDDVHGAGGRVPPPERALGTAQDLDPLQVEEGIDRRLRPRHVDAVHVVADGRLGADAEGAGADAADDDGDFARRRALAGDHDAGGGLGQRLHVDDRLSFELFARTGDDGDRHVLDRLLHALGRYRDLVGDGGFRLLGILCRRGAGRQSQRNKKDQGENRNGTHLGVPLETAGRRVANDSNLPCG